jgi:hypothetical protein
MLATSYEKLHAANGDANQITTWLSPCAMVNIGLNHKQAMLFSSHAKCTVFVW